MENEGRIVELLAEMLHKFDVLNEKVGVLTDKVEILTDEMIEVKTDIKTMNSRLERVENEIVKLNLTTAENSRALMKLADYTERINRLEKAVFK
jgi:peptidoglycan hydrolase CwlO-like protein